MVIVNVPRLSETTETGLDALFDFVSLESARLRESSTLKINLSGLLHCVETRVPTNSGGDFSRDLETVHAKLRLYFSLTFTSMDSACTGRRS